MSIDERIKTSIARSRDKARIELYTIKVLVDDADRLLADGGIPSRQVREIIMHAAFALEMCGMMRSMERLSDDNE